MNIYDFDKTIYENDSTVDFYFYSLFHHPGIIKYLPKQLWGFFKYFTKRINITEMKRYLYIYFQGLKDIDNDMAKFWDKNIHKIHAFYAVNQKSDDIVISASPQFQVEEACKRLGIKTVIASKVDKKTGEVLSANCSRQEKVNRFIQAGYKVEDIDEFYSDSLHDTSLAKIAKKAFIIDKGKVKPWIFK